MTRIIAERFIVSGATAVDMATADRVRISLAPLAPARMRERADLCDRLVNLAHPLLLPLVDYGATSDGWFEAYADLPPLRAAPADVRAAAPHLVRFLRAADVALTADATSRAVRAAIGARRGPWRALGLRLLARPVVGLVKTLADDGAGGLLRIDLHGPPGSGLRTVRGQVARLARLAGFVVVDRVLGTAQAPPGRHYCVLQWEDERLELPPLLVAATRGGVRRHLWVRFLRHVEPRDSSTSLLLAPLTPAELRGIVYSDIELGPRTEEIRLAAERAGGLPGAFVNALSGPAAAIVPHVHEAPAVYLAQPARAALPAAERIARRRRDDVVRDAAIELMRRRRYARAERVLARAATRTAGKTDDGMRVEIACLLAHLRTLRGRPSAALDALGTVADIAPAGPVLVETARALRELDRLDAAESTVRTALAGLLEDSRRHDALCLLTELQIDKGDLDAAAGVLATAGNSPHAAALLGWVAVQRGSLLEAAALAARVGDACAADATLCLAQCIQIRMAVRLGDGDALQRAAAAALGAARRSGARALPALVAAELLRARPATDTDGRRARRLRRLAAALPPRARRDILSRLDAGDARTAGGEPVAILERCLSIVMESRSEADAVRRVAEEARRELGAASLVIHGRWTQVACAGRDWTPDAASVRAVQDGGGWSFMPGMLPVAIEPVRAGGEIVGVVAARWGTGRTPDAGASHGVLRVCAAAVAMTVDALNAPAPDPGVTAYPDALLGDGPVAGRVREAILRAAGAPYPVLIEGESGSGKEVVARAVHARGPRRARRFCAVNCAALTDDLLEAELFGHAKGAFRAR